MSGAPAVISRLQEICGREFVLTHQHELATYRSDGLLHYREVPAAAVLPGTAQEVREVVQACFEAEVPWVARGSGTGLSGGALPVAEGVLIVLSRLRRILEIDLDNGRVVVEPGVTNVSVTRAVSPTHFYPPDPSSQIVCSIGGNVAENSGGAHCFKYGFTTNYVVGLEVVLSDGTMVTLDRDAPGYDLLGAFVGSEGTLGVATKIVLRVIPAPESVSTMLAFFDDTGAAGDAVTAIVDAGIVPGAIEMMDRLSIEAAEQSTGAGYRLDAGAALIIELDGPSEECLVGLERLTELCTQAGSLDVRIAQSDAERDLIWRTRKAAFAAMGRIAPAYYVQDGVIPRTRLSEVLRQVDGLATDYKLRVANVFHAGDGNLHPLVCYDSGVEGEAARAEELAGLIIKACVDAGGSITGEHGVGVDKKAYMPSMFSEPDLEAFQRLRCAFDPHGLANPGKVMPTPRLCGEVPGPYREHPLERAGVAERF
ncbi:MAG TPA: FAD-linked oxidase C-terminal domain-containing protein [Solirubrobacteraceae bacterium]|jgi:glycolate oxidase|nr:FAD-linked oxidase C-terminal domain-containing protein [Solirubrobacteraceae bacterium]